MNARERRDKRAKWTPERDTYLREHYPVESAVKIARYLNVSESSVRSRAFSLGIKKGKSINKICWTPEMVAYLEEHYPTGKFVEIARHLGCRVPSVKWKAKQLGLVRTPKNPNKAAKKAKPDKAKCYGNESRIGMNQAEVTDATRTVICSCALDGMTVKQTATMTERAIEQVRAVLKECQESGYLDWIKSRRESSLGVRHDRSACRMCSGFANAGTE